MAGSEAAWQMAQAGVPVVLHEMRPTRTPHKTDALAELVCSNSFRSDDAEHNAVGLLHEEMRRLGSLIMGAARRTTRCRPAARWRSTATDFPLRSPAASTPSADRARARGDRGLPPEDWDNVIVATGPLTSPALAEAIARPDRRGAARLLRRHCADRASRQHRYGCGLVPVALRQGGSRRHRRRLHQLPDDARTV